MCRPGLLRILTMKQIIHHDSEKGTAKIIVEKRDLGRIPIDRDIFIKADGFFGFMPARLSDISSGGALIQTKAPLRMLQEFELYATEGSMMFARANVVRLAPRNQGFGVRWSGFFSQHLPKGFMTKTRV